MAKEQKVRLEQKKGKVKDRTQVFNPVTGNYLKRDSSGKFIEVKSNGKAFKGVKKEPQITKGGASLSKIIAQKAEQSVIKTINRNIVR